jgi:two-component system response regulator AtoC
MKNRIFATSSIRQPGSDMPAQCKDRLTLSWEDGPELRSYLGTALCDGSSVDAIEDDQEPLDRLRAGVPDSAVLLDVMMPERGGVQVLCDFRNSGRNLPVIVISGTDSPGVRVEVMRIGASDFTAKPIRQESLRRALNGVLEAAGTAPPRSPEQVATSTLFFGSSPAMCELQTASNLVARSDTPVLITGETGSGKEMLARHVHAHSRRAGQPFIKLNCAALRSELVESELFGCEPRMFTGAFQRKPGIFEMADGGTLLLDEIGDMDFKLQAKLLQVLQDHEFKPLGGKETVRVDVRVIAATHQDLEKSIAAGTFRQDLYYRLNVVGLRMPPLREHREDIVQLVGLLVEKHRSDDQPAPEITPALKQALLLHDWPGNVRELENVVRKLTVIRDADLVARGLASLSTRKTLAVPAFDPPAKPEPVPASAPILEQVTRARQQAETEAILAALNTTRWNRKKAAALLKIDYKALLYKMKKLAVDGRSPSMEGVASVEVGRDAAFFDN